jgi:hypothetical protein
MEEGWMQVGDEMTLVERKYPHWTIERIQEYLHRDKNNLQKLMELEKIEEFGDECKGAFKNRVAKLKADEEDQLNGGKKKESEVWREFEVVEKKVQTKRITSFTLERPGDGEELDPGHFARLKLPNGLIRPYSIIGGKTNRFQLGIALEENSRGGSRFLHEKIQQGDRILVGKLTESVPITSSASNHIFIAGVCVLSRVFFPYLASSLSPSKNIALVVVSFIGMLLLNNADSRFCRACTC